MVYNVKELPAEDIVMVEEPVAAAYEVGRTRTKPWVDADSDGDSDWDGEGDAGDWLDRKLENDPEFAAHFYGKLEESRIAREAGLVIPHEEVFRDLERKILTGSHLPPAV